MFHPPLTTASRTLRRVIVWCHQCQADLYTPLLQKSNLPTETDALRPTPWTDRQEHGRDSEEQLRPAAVQHSSQQPHLPRNQIKCRLVLESSSAGENEPRSYCAPVSWELRFSLEENQVYQFPRLGKPCSSELRGPIPAF